MHKLSALIALLCLASTSVFAANVQLPGMEKVDYSCHHVSTCESLPPHVTVKGVLCSYQAAVGLEKGTGQGVIVLVVGDYDINTKAITNLQVARKALLGNYDLSDARDIVAEPVKYGPISMKFDSIGKTGSFKYRGYVPNGASWIEVTGARCE